MALQDLVLSSQCKFHFKPTSFALYRIYTLYLSTFEITLSLCYGRTLSNNLIGGSIPELPPTLVNMYVMLILNMN